MYGHKPHGCVESIEKSAPAKCPKYSENGPDEGREKSAQMRSVGRSLLLLLLLLMMMLKSKTLIGWRRGHP
jgi:hypothetical protein